jgi:hypothetical protein
MTTKNASKIKTLGYAILFVFITSAQVFAQTPAPLGTYTATTGSSMVTGKSAATGAQGGLIKKGFSKPAEAGAGNTITITLQSYSTKEEISQLKAAQGNPQQFMTTLSSFQHGTVSMGGKSFPINMASSNSRSGKFVVTILSSKAFSNTGGQLTTGKALSTGLIELFVDASGTGQGVLRASTQIAFDSKGALAAKGGGAMSKTTELTGVSRQ